MPLYPTFFILVFFMGTFLSLFRGPIYGLITYVFVYFNIPSHQWWGSYLPDLRWSFIAAGLLTLSALLHKSKLGKIHFGVKFPPAYLVSLLLLMCAIAPFAYSPPIAWQKVYDFFRYVYIYILVALIITNEKNFKLFIYSLCCFYLYLAWQAHFYFRGGRLDGIGLPDASDANMLAALILLIIPVPVQFILHGSKAEKLFGLAIIAPLANVFIMCGSRGGFIGLIVEIFVMAALEVKKGRQFKTLIVFCVLFAGFWGLTDEQYKNRLFGLKTSVAEGSLEQNSAGRIAIWKEGICMLADYPFGTGGGGFMELSPRYIDGALIESSVGKRAAHNTYLTILIEQGLLGLILYGTYIITNVTVLLHVKKVSVVEFQHKNDCLNLQKSRLQQCDFLLPSLVGFIAAILFIDRVYFEYFYIFSALIIVNQNINKNTK